MQQAVAGVRERWSCTLRAMPDPQPGRLETFRAPLRRWYRQAGRALPWREPRDAYAIWVSEVMLQQTRVETVLRYYEPFLERFPNVTTLAEAPEEAVRAAWAGLGYYRRAKLLQQGARTVSELHGGVVPSGLAELLALPGVGRYTAGAIRSFGFDLPAPVVDGNVGRVLSRLMAIDGAVDETRVRAAHWALAEQYHDREAPNESNQAILELGAVICTPARPSCDRCPVARGCLSLSLGRVDDIPTPKARRPSPTIPRSALVVHDALGRILLQQRPGAGLLASMWEPPSAEGAGQAEAIDTIWTTAGGAGPLRDCGVVEHVFTHRRWRTRVWSGQVPGSGASVEGRWIAPDALSAVALPTATARMLEAAGVPLVLSPRR